MPGSLGQLGIGKETTYGTAVAVNKFYEIVKESIAGNYGRITADALSSAYVDRQDRWVPLDKGAKGTVTLEPLTKGFGHWLAYLLGSVTTTGPTETSVYTHAAIMGSLSDKSLTVQVGRPNDNNVVVPWTYSGGVVTDFEFSNKAEATLSVDIGLDFQHEACPSSPSGAFALQTNTPVTGAEVLTSVGGTITIDGTPLDVNDISIKVDNQLNTDRPIIRQGTPKKRPVEDGKRKITWSGTVSYPDQSLWQKVSAQTAAGATGHLVVVYKGLTLLGTTLYPSLTLDIPVATFDEGGPTIDGPKMLEQKISGSGKYNGTDAPLTATYVSADTTVLPN